MSADPSDRRAALDALSEVTTHLAHATRALEHAETLRVVHSITADEPETAIRLTRALERAERYAYRLRNAAAAWVLWDVDVPKTRRVKR